MTALQNPKKAFTDCYRAFSTALRATFPELETAIRFAESQIPVDMHLTKFWSMVRGLGRRIEDCDSTLLRDPEFHVIPGVSLAAVWDEDLGDETRTAIWKYMLNLYKLAEIIRTPVAVLPTTEETPDDSDDSLDEDEEDVTGIASLLNMGTDMSNNIAKLQSVFANVARATEVDGSGGMPAFSIPDELKESTLFKLVQDLVTELNPRDLGLDPAEVEGLTAEQALARVVELYERNPEKIMGLVKRIGGKLQTRIQSGSLTQSALLEDAKKFIKFLETNETLRSIAEPLKDIFESMSSQFTKMTGRGGRGRPGGAAGATTVRDRLRRNAEKRAAAQASTQATAETVAATGKTIDELVKEIEGTTEKSKRKKSTKK